MEEITKNIIQNTTLLRKIHILEKLIENDNIIPSKILANQLHCTNRTILNDISELKQILPNNWEIITIPAKGYLLKKPNFDKLAHVITPYLINSEIHKILLGIFNCKYYTLEKWSQLLYLSKSTLKKKLENFAKTLHHFGLTFSFKTLQLTGEELNIRYFYVIYFYTIQKYKEFMNLHPYLQKKIDDITRTYGINLDINLLTIIINVFVNRHMHKCQITQNSGFKSIFYSKKVKCIKSTISEIEQFYGMNFSEKELYFFSLSYHLISEGNIKEKIDIANYFQETHREFYKASLSIFDIISSKFKLNFYAKEKIKHDIFYQINKINILKQYNLPTKYILEQCNNLKREIPELMESYGIIHPLIISWNKTLIKNRLNKNEIHYIIFNTLFAIHLNSSQKGLLLLSGPTTWKNFIYYKLNSELGNTINIYSESNNFKNYDFIITNYKIDINNIPIPVLQISDRINEQDLKYIRKFLYYNIVVKNKKINCK
ncbi:HTH domain-containing protein (plasmid) [Bacillus sp. JAS24-2]|uniref:helix-turn-helix domain-containing protein n=1 Tax=Bacillus sp. JAS24-2 TaxID=2217832 RepID=UPI0011EF5EBB|nr:helix-turn-helix domain-containing protein [Bacillus sp. JAS24-2]QEL82860.1 HTH domain-containing protein [Bacillus sp. JAS24-2]